MRPLRPEARSARERAERDAAAFIADGCTVLAIVELLATEDDENLKPNVGPAIAEGLARAVASFILTGIVEEEVDADAGVAWVVLTEALACAATDGAIDAKRLTEIGARFERAPGWAVDRWYERCLAGILRLPDEERTKTLRSLGAEPSVREGQSALRPAVSVVRSEATWAVSDPFQLWDDQSATDIALTGHAPLRLLWMADRQQWFRAVEQWSDPRLVQGALVAFEDCTTLEDLANLIRSAQPAFDDAGLFTGRAAAIVICALAVARTHPPEGAVVSLDELASRFRQFAEALVSRPDGLRLAAALSTWLYQKAALWPRVGTRRTEANRVAFNALSDLLGALAIPVTQLRAFAAQRRAVRGDSAAPWQRDLPALFAAAHSLTDRAEDMTTHMQWLRDVLSQTDEWQGAQTPDTLVQELVARLRREADPVRACTELFEALEFDRRRAEFGRSFDERDCALPSLILLFVLGVLVATGAECDVFSTVRFVIERALRLKLTSFSFTPSRVPPRDVLGMGLAAASVRLGPTDPRTMELVLRVSDHADVLGMLLVRLEPQLRASLLAALQMSVEEVIRRVDAWAASDGSADGTAVAIAVTDALRTVANPI